MPINRRTFLQISAGAAASALFRQPAASEIPNAPGIKALAFDAFPIFDPRSIAALAEKLYPGRGAELIKTWRIRQFEYQWLRALGGRYEDFWRTTEDALVYAAELLRLELSAESRAALMNSYLELKAWPDVEPALQSLRRMGVRLSFLSNATPEILEAGIRNSGLEGIFERVLSTDQIKTFKPHPRAYQLGVDELGLPKGAILFVAFAGWDVAGAKWFGYPTFWVNRLGLPAEQLRIQADGVGKDLRDLTGFVRRYPGV